MLNSTVVPASIEELSALGVALAAGLTTGIWKDKAEFEQLISPNQKFTPKIENDNREKLYSGWQAALKKARSQF